MKSNNEEVPSPSTYFSFPDNRRSEGARLVRKAVSQVMFNGKQRRAALNFESGKRKTCFLPSEESILERVCLHVRGKSDRGLHLTLRVQIPYARYEWEDSEEKPQPDDFYDREFNRIIDYHDDELDVPIIPAAEVQKELLEQAAEAGYDLAPDTENTSDSNKQKALDANRRTSRRGFVLLFTTALVVTFGFSPPFEPIRQKVNEKIKKMFGSQDGPKNLTQE